MCMNEISIQHSIYRISVAYVIQNPPTDLFFAVNTQKTHILFVLSYFRKLHFATFTSIVEMNVMWTPHH